MCDINALVKEFTDMTKTKKKNPLAPDCPFRMLITGTSGCGKTHLLCDLILNYLTFDKLYVVSTTLFQPKYQMLQAVFEKVDNTVLEDLESQLKKVKINKKHLTEERITEIV